MSQKNQKQLEEILLIFSAADAKSIPLWLESGWAVDARLGSTTRDHEDIDIAYAAVFRIEFETMLRTLGYIMTEKNDDRFLMSKGEILIDAEPGIQDDKGYHPEGFPEGCLPKNREGRLQNATIHCISWEGMFWEFLFYTKEVPLQNWRTKDIETLEIITKHLNRRTIISLQKRFKKEQG